MKAKVNLWIDSEQAFGFSRSSVGQDIDFFKFAIDKRGGSMIYYPSVVTYKTKGEVAQLVEQRTHKPWVEGSSPSFATIQELGSNPEFFFFPLASNRQI